MIRKMKPEDKEKVMSIAKKYLEHLYGDQKKQVETWVYGLKDKVGFVYEENGEIGGILVLSLKPHKKYLKISSLVVDEKYRRKGVGKTFLEISEKYANYIGKEEISVTVGDDVELSKRFFEKHGYKLVDKLYEKYRKGKYELIYSKRLK